MITKNRDLFTQKNIISFFLYFTFFIVPFSILSYTTITVDDILYSKIENILDSVIIRYHYWSSRYFIDILAIFFCKYSRFAFVIINMVVLSTIPISIYFIFKNILHKEFLWTIYALVSTYHIQSMFSAGPISTSLNYSWPLACLLFVIAISCSILNTGAVRLWIFCIACVAALFATNQEQACIITFISSASFSIVFFLKRKKINKQLFLLFMICCFSLSWIVSSPGNYNRYYDEVTRWYPDFLTFSFIYKAYLGLITTTHRYFFDLNLSYLSFALLSAFAFYEKYKENMTRSGLAYIFTPALFPIGIYLLKKTLAFNYTYIIDASNFHRPYLYIIFFISIYIISIILFSIFHIFKNTEYLYPMLYIFFTGFLSRLLIGFSPTLFPSGSRTFIFLDFSFILMSVFILSMAKIFPVKLLEYILFSCAATQILIFYISQAIR